ncbi:MFS general substrate transporter [Phellopilus nigrolimitatus]|nr:MFS general substrate transporter [Phellopilus nigrolimitatus]
MTGFGGLAIADGSEGADVRWAGVSKILGPSWLQLPTLTVGLLGVQVLWSVEMSYASPYLISLGLSKSLTAVAFLAGPLSGLIVQPLIGVIADNSKSRFGRRRPYMMLATVLCAASMLLLGFTRDFVSIFTPRESSINDTLTIVFAVIALYGIDFSVNAVQAVDRALIVDTVPFSLQPDGNAWAARMLGIGSVIGFFIGNLNLHEILSIFGNSQLEVLSVLAAFLLLSTQSTTAACVKEKVIISSSRARKNLSQEIREIWDNILTLPRVIRQICIIQFLAWLAWFPVLFYTTVYIGDLYKSALPVPADDAAATVQDDQATIVGARAFFFFGLMALTANFVLPLFVKGEDDARVASPTFKKVSFMNRLKVVHLCELWAASHLLFALCMGATFFVSNVHGATFLISLVGFSWAMTQWAPFSLLAEEILASSSQEEQSFDDSGSISIRLLDARTGRASELLSEDADIVWDESDERQRLMDDERRGRIATSRNSGEDAANSLAGSRTSSFESARHNVHSRASSVSNGLLGNAAARQSRAELLPDAMNADTRVRFDTDPESLPRVRPSGLQAKSGIIIGIHNLFIVIPQFISTALASLVFALFDPAKSVRHGHNPGIGLPGNGTVPVGITMNGENSTSLLFFPREGEEETEVTGVNSVAILFRIGGVSALFAFVLCWRLARELRRGR